jgi:hypothetical protein
MHVTLTVHAVRAMECQCESCLKQVHGASALHNMPAHHQRVPWNVLVQPGHT